MTEAWRLRTTNFPPLIVASHPVDTLPISVTGAQCALNCAHCGRHYLAGMRPLAEVGEVKQPSILISGGCDSQGRVPLVECLSTLRPLVQDRRSVWHLGLVTEDDLRALQPFLDTVAFDFVGDDYTIREVYGLSASADDYERTFAALNRIASVAPHITIGLLGGTIGHEWAALERLSRYGFRRLVLLVLTPTPGTVYEKAAPPPLAEVARVIAEARLRFPSVSLQLGCMRPAGGYRQVLDVIAVRAGVNVIVNPASTARGAAENLGLRWQVSHECCVFAPTTEPVQGACRLPYNTPAAAGLPQGRTRRSACSAIRPAPHTEPSQEGTYV